MFLLAWFFDSHLGLKAGHHSFLAAICIMAYSFSKSRRQNIWPSLKTNWSPFWRTWPHTAQTKHWRWYTWPTALMTSSLAGICCKHPAHLLPKYLQSQMSLLNWYIMILFLFYLIKWESSGFWTLDPLSQVPGTLSMKHYTLKYVMRHAQILMKI